ncbi:MAG TPA: hypothetical protein VMS93_01825 [Candidatus Saccharimonadales bacterium]|nr:hypothetical protein [Candidatus Saccharimonadales bacterium]
MPAPKNRPAFLFLALVVAALVHAPAAGALVLTSQGITEGFSLSTFASGFPSSSNIGPLGVAWTASGGVMVSDFPGNVRVFATDADGQLASSAPVGQSYGLANAVGLARVGGSFFMTRQAIGDLVQLNPDGTFNQGIFAGLPAATGLVTDPITGHVYVSTLGNNQIWDVDPVAKTGHIILSKSADGLTTDGHVLYMEEGGHITGYDLTTHAQVFDSGFISGADGTSLGYGTLAGKIFANTNFGEVYEIDLGTAAKTLIANGGTRGDFVAADPNGTLLLTQSTTLERLTAPAGGGFGAVPEPATGLEMLLGALLMAGGGLYARLKG